MLGTFAKLRKATISFVMSVRLSFRPHGTTRFPLHGFSWNLISEDFSKICGENSSFMKNRTRINVTLHEDQRIFYNIFRSFLLRTRNISDKLCRENQNTYFVFGNSFRYSCHLWYKWKNNVGPGGPQITIWRMRIACWIAKARNTHTGCVKLIALPLEQVLYERASMLLYRVIQEESAFLWEMIVWVILSKNVHTNMGPILNGYEVMGIF